MRELNWDRLDDVGKIQGPIIVPISRVVVDPSLIRERDVKKYVNAPSTQDWYFEPIKCVKIGPDQYEANGLWAHSMVEACHRLGYKDLQICYVEVSTD